MDYYIHPTAVVDERAQIGRGTRIWHFVQVREEAVIGEDCIIGKSAYIDKAVVLGNRVKIQNFAAIYQGVTIEDDVFIGPSVAFTNDMYPRSWIWHYHRIVKSRVKKCASIGANSTIVAGVTLGEYAMVGAGSVVTKDVEPYQLVYGNPAKPHGWVCTCGKTLGEKKPEKVVCTHKEEQGK